MRLPAIRNEAITLANGIYHWTIYFSGFYTAEGGHSIFKSSAINKQIGTLANLPITYEHRLISYNGHMV